MTRDNYEMKEKQQQQLTSENEVKKLFHEYLKFEKLVRHGAVDLEYVHGDPDHKTYLEMAVSDPNKIDFVKLLLEHEVQVNNVNVIHSAAPIHFAVENGNLEALKLLLECDRIYVDVKSNGDTALLMAIKKIGALNGDRKNESTIYEDMIELLLKAGCNANSPDAKGITPVYYAATLHLEKVVTLMLNYSKESVNLDIYQDLQNNTARYYLTVAFPRLVLPRFNIDNFCLFNYLNRHEDDNFVRDFLMLTGKNEHRPALTANDGIETMLQLATDKGLERAVFTLLNFKADPNVTGPANTSRPIAIACRRGYARILKMFIDNKDTLFDPVNGECLLQIAIKGMRSYSKDPKANYDNCLRLLIKHLNSHINVNCTDVNDNTALHYVARNGDNDTVLDLLRNGACVGLRNKYDEPPLADINAKTLETYLDECITTNGKMPSDEDYEIHMKYSFLVYPNKLCKKPLTDNSSNNNNIELDAILAPETDALLYMTRNEELKPLLKHPVIISFLYLKWQRISYFVYANITFYSFIWLCLILYIILGYRSELKYSIVTHVGASVGWILLFLRELLHVLISPVKYLQSKEKGMEIILIIVTIWIISYYSAADSTKELLSVIAILLSSAKLVLLFGQLPIFYTYIVMLKTVSKNFFKFLLWYSLIIIAFAFSFYTLFKHKEDENQKPSYSNNTRNDDMNEDFFEDPIRSLFKTILMLTGEFEAGSIKFSKFPVTSHIIFIIFVFNFYLMNSLAVSDTQEIRADAELLGHISRIKLISYFESVLIGNACSKPSMNWSCLPESWQRVLLVIRSQWIMFFIKPKRITLFLHYLPKYRIIVKPNQHNKIKIPLAEPPGEVEDNYKDVEGGGCCFEKCQTYRLDRNIVKNVKVVIAKKRYVSELDEIKEKLSLYETKFESLEDTLKEVQKSTEKTKRRQRTKWLYEKSNFTGEAKN